MIITLHFGGHETFPLRHAWLPKAANLVRQDATFLSDELRVVEEAGVGLNMARSIQHWAESCVMVKRKSRGVHELTNIGEVVFSLKGDQYLERSDTLWLIHYLIATNAAKNGLWYYIFNKYTRELISKEDVVNQVRLWAQDHLTKSPAKRTIEKDFDCCMNMYCATDLSEMDRNAQNLLASPLKELRLIYPGENKKRFVLRRMNNAEISPELFTYCMIDYLIKEQYPNSVTFDELLLGEGSPGRIFRMTESVLVQYLGEFERITKRKYIYDTTAGMRQILRFLKHGFAIETWLKKIYD